MRRFALLTLGCLAIAGALLAGGGRAAAGTIPCREVYGAGGGYVCGTQVDSKPMDPAYQPGQTQAACWADSIAMIVAANFGTLSQSDILSSIFGAAVPSALPAATAQTYLNHSYTSGHSVTDTTGTALFSSSVAGSRGALRAIASQLADETPLLVFTSSRALVLTAIYYHADVLSKPTSYYVGVVRDPCPAPATPVVSGVKPDLGPGERLLSLAEYNDIQSVYTVSVKNH